MVSCRIYVGAFRILGFIYNFVSIQFHTIFPPLGEEKMYQPPAFTAPSFHVVAICVSAEYYGARYVWSQVMSGLSKILMAVKPTFTGM